MNGMKFNTGLLIAVLTLCLQQIGMPQGMAEHYVTSITYGLAAACSVIGYIHQWVKKGKAMPDTPPKPANALEEIQKAILLVEQVKTLVSVPAVVTTTQQL